MLGRFLHFCIVIAIQTVHSVAPKLQIFVSSLENCQNFSKTSTLLEFTELDSMVAVVASRNLTQEVIVSSPFIPMIHFCH